ncbi:MAG TPA: glycosyltransferase family 39 protein [Candidatus Binatia bacterium]
MTSSAARRALGLVALTAIVAIAFALDLGRPHFWDPGEGRYAETVREMLLTRNWIVPTLEFANYYDKPPGFFWLVAGCFKLFGPTEWAGRLPSALAAVLTIAVVVAFAWRRLGPATALGAGALLATAGQFVALGRSVRMDMPLAFAVTGTLLYAYALLTDEEHTRATWPLYLVAAIGVLVKGPVAIVLPMLVLGVYAALTGRLRLLPRLRPGWGALVGLVIAGSWYAIAALRAPDYLRSFLWQQNVGRFLEGARGSGHSEPFWFYFWVLPLTFLPWTPFLPGALARSVRRARAGQDLDTFLLVWTGVIFIFFTLARAKLATYLLPLFPALAFVVVAYLDEALAAPPDVRRRALAVPTTVWAIALAGVTLAVSIPVAIRYPPFAWHALSALTLLAFPAVALLLGRRDAWQAVPLLILVASLYSQALFYRVGSPIVNEFISLRQAAEVARALPDDALVYAFHTRGHSFTFYGGRALTRMQSPEAAAEALRGDQPVGLLTKKRYLARIQAHLTEPVCIWWQGVSGRVLLANRPFPDSTHHAALLPGKDKQIDGNSPRC